MPAGFRPVMRQDWGDLLFLHWRVEPAALAPLLPAGLELDTREGSAWVGLVPFSVRRVRYPGLPPLPLVSSFGEINVRTYARLPGGERGVWFFSLDAGSPLAVIAARLAYRLPYFAARVRLEREGDTRFFFSDRIGRPGRSRITWRVTDDATARAEPGSLEEFLIERYVLFAGKNGRLFRARVAHRPYPLARATLTWLREDLLRAGGIGVSGDPLVHYSPGVDVEVSAPEGGARSFTRP